MVYFRIKMSCTGKRSAAVTGVGVEFVRKTENEEKLLFSCCLSRKVSLSSSPYKKMKIRIENKDP